MSDSHQQTDRHDKKKNSKTLELDGIIDQPTLTSTQHHSHTVKYAFFSGAIALSLKEII